MVYFTSIWFFMAIGYIFPPFGMLYQEKSGNPDDDVFIKINDLDVRARAPPIHYLSDFALK
jgi:hypothetical protein